jgi:hypothetical protein
MNHHAWSTPEHSNGHKMPLGKVVQLLEVGDHPLLTYPSVEAVGDLLVTKEIWVDISIDSMNGLLLFLFIYFLL